METTQSLFPLEPSGGSAVPGRSSALPGSDRGAQGELFDREVERAQDRAGGPQAVEDRQAADHATRRRARRDAFHEHRMDRRREIAEGGRGDQRPEADPVAAPATRLDPAATDSAPFLPYGSIPEPAPVTLPEGPAPAASGRPDGLVAHPLAPIGRGPAPGVTPTPAQTAAGVPAVAAGRVAAPPPTLPAAGAAPATPATRPAAAPLAPAPAASEPPLEQAPSVLHQIRVHLAAGGREATLHLLPQELGRLQVRLALREGRLQAAVRAESPETLALLELHLPELRAALAQQGLDVEGFQLDLGLEDRPDDRPSQPLPQRHERETLLTVEADRSLRAISADGIDTYA